MSGLSEKQLEIYEYVQSRIRSDGLPPSVREIGQAVGLRSTSTVHAHLKVLEREGYIRRDGRKMRAIHMSGQENENVRRVPVLGRVTAGQPILAVEDIEGYVPFDKPVSGDLFALRVRGDSMINAGILSGDIIIVRRQPTAEPREIVVAMLGEEATVKRLAFEGSHPWLMPENDAYRPIDGLGCQILGKVVALYRDEIE